MSSRKQEVVDRFGRSETGGIINCSHKEHRYSVLVKYSSDAENNKEFTHAPVL